MTLKRARDVLHASETTLRYALWLSLAQLPVLLVVLWSRMFLCLACVVDLSMMILMVYAIVQWQDAKLLISLENLDRTVAAAHKVLDEMSTNKAQRGGTLPTGSSISRSSFRPSQAAAT